MRIKTNKNGLLLLLKWCIKAILFLSLFAFKLRNSSFLKNNTLSLCLCLSPFSRLQCAAAAAPPSLAPRSFGVRSGFTKTAFHLRATDGRTTLAKGEHDAREKIKASLCEVVLSNIHMCHGNSHLLSPSVLSHLCCVFLRVR